MDELETPDIRDWLAAQGFKEEIIQTMEDNDVDFEVLCTMTEDDLREIGIMSFGLRRKLKIAIDKMNAAIAAGGDLSDNCQGRHQRLSPPPKPIPVESVLVVGDHFKPLTNDQSHLPSTSQQYLPMASQANFPLTNQCRLAASSQPQLHVPVTSQSNLPLSCHSHSPVTDQSCSSKSNQWSLPMPDHSHIPKFCVHEMLQRHTEGRTIAAHLERGGLLTTKQRRILIRIVVGALIEKCGLYPSAPQKTALAMEIVNTFPSTRDSTPGMKGHEHFYDNGHGFIEYRLKTIRHSCPHMKRRQRSPKKLSNTTQLQEACSTTPPIQEPLPCSQVIADKIKWMKYSPVSQENRSQDRQYFKETHAYRRAVIARGGMSITDILHEYPKMQTMPELINMEFKMMYPDNSENFINNWSSFYRDRILAIARQEYQAVANLVGSYQSGNQDLCALNILAYMLHRPVNRRKGKEHHSATNREGAMSYLIQNYPEGTDINAAVRDKDDRYTQPFLMSVGPKYQPQQYFLVLDRVAVPAGESLVEAVDRLFKCHYVFSVDFTSTLSQFWEFLAVIVYEVAKPNPAGAQIRTLGATIRAMTL